MTRAPLHEVVGVRRVIVLKQQLYRELKTEALTSNFPTLAGEGGGHPNYNLLGFSAALAPKFTPAKILKVRMAVLRKKLRAKP